MGDFAQTSCKTRISSTVFAIKNRACIDALINKIYKFGPKIKEDKYIQKRSLFCDSIFVYLAKIHKDDIFSIKDSVVSDFDVNNAGRIDSVWLVPPKPFPFINTYRFINNMTVRGLWLSSTRLVSHSTIKLIILFNRK